MTVEIIKETRHSFFVPEKSVQIFFFNIKNIDLRDEADV